MRDRLDGPTGNSSSNSSNSSWTQRDNSPERGARRSALPHASERPVRQNAEIEIRGRKRDRDDEVQIGEPQFKQPRTNCNASESSHPRGGETDRNPLPNPRQAATMLTNAVLSNDLQAARQALLAGANVNERDEEGNLPLSVAAFNGRLDIVRLLCEQGVSPSRVRSALDRAVADDHFEVVKFLLTLPHDPNTRHKDCTRFLLKAKSLNVAKLLHGEGGDLHARHAKGRTCLMRAAKEQCADFVKWLLDQGLQVNDRDDEGQTALYWALRDRVTLAASRYARDPYETVQELLTRGADPNHVGKSGDTPLMLSAKFPNPDIMTELLHHGAQINPVNTHPEQMTALLYAARSGEAKHVIILVEAGAKLDVVDNLGRSALHLACARGNADVALTLLALGLHPGVADKNGRTAAMDAVASGDPFLVLHVWNALKSAKLDAAYAVSLVHEAARGTSYSVLNWLLDQSQIPIDTPGEDQKTVLHWLSTPSQCWSKDDLIGSVLARNPNLNARDQQGNTPLMLAARMRNANLVRHLLNANADVHQHNAVGRNALDEALALQNSTSVGDPPGNHGIAEQLILQGATVTSKMHSNERGGYSVDAFAEDMLSWPGLIGAHPKNIEALNLPKLTASLKAKPQGFIGWLMGQSKNIDELTRNLKNVGFLALIRKPLVHELHRMRQDMRKPQMGQLVGAILASMDADEPRKKILGSDLSPNSKDRFEKVFLHQCKVLNTAGTMIKTAWYDMGVANLKKTIAIHINVLGTVLDEELRETLTNIWGLQDAATDLLLNLIIETNKQLLAQPAMPGTLYSEQLMTRLVEALRTQDCYQPGHLPWSQQEGTVDFPLLNGQWDALRTILGAPVPEQAETEGAGQAQEEDEEEGAADESSDEASGSF